MGRQRLNPALQYGRRHDHRQEAAELPPPVGDDPAFVMLVKTDNPGTSGTNQMTLPLTGSYTIDWGDGVVENLSGAQTHTYPAPGEYTIRITGGLTAIAFANGGDKSKLLDIQNWGDIAWTTMLQAFWGCANLIGTATDVPDLSLVTSIAVTFFQATNFNGDVSGWNVSNVTNIASAFREATNFNSDISGWNVDNVTNMTQTFDTATNFNSDISGWNTANVTFMGRMFNNATSFNQNLGSWNMSKVTDVVNMLRFITLSPANYGSLLIGWAAQTLKSGVNFHGGNSKYPTDGTGNPATDAAAARAKIIADFGWTVTDGGPV